MPPLLRPLRPLGVREDQLAFAQRVVDDLVEQGLVRAIPRSDGQLGYHLTALGEQALHVPARSEVGHPPGRGATRRDPRYPRPPAPPRGAATVSCRRGARLRPDTSPLDHPRRALIYSYVQQAPGTSFSEVVRKTGIPAGTARHHLSILKRHQLIVEHAHCATTRFFENHGKWDDSWRAVVLLREAPLRHLHEWLCANGAVPQKRVLEAMAGQGWSRSTTQHRLGRLATHGILRVRLQGRLKVYSVPSPSSHLGLSTAASAPSETLEAPA